MSQFFYGCQVPPLKTRKETSGGVKTSLPDPSGSPDVNDGSVLQHRLALEASTVKSIDLIPNIGYNNSRRTEDENDSDYTSKSGLPVPISGTHTPVNPGEVALYPRKSTATENASKSIQDQIEVILETLDEVGLPPHTFVIKQEKIGHGGDEWWSGGGQSGLKDDTGTAQPTRPVLTEIMDGVVNGTHKVVACYAQDRLWRKVGICDKMVDLFLENGVQLYDRYGLVDIRTPEGRQQVRSNAVASQHYRERVTQDSDRGKRKNIEKGKLVTGADVLGFRSGGRYSKIVLHRPEEHLVVRRIFTLFDRGESGRGPLSCEEIAKLLMEEGYLWTPDLRAKRGKKRNDFTMNLIYDWQIKKVLTDCRYQGRQPYSKKEWPCDAFLVDGQPLVEVDVYERVQAKIDSFRRSGNRTRKDRAATGLIRCGLCGQGLSVSPTSVKATGERIHYWKNIKSEAWCWCTHTLPSLREVVVDTWLDEVLAPLLLAEMREKAAGQSHQALLSQQAELRRVLCHMEEAFEQRIEEFIRENVGAKIIGTAERAHSAKTAAIHTQTKENELLIRDYYALEVGLADLASQTPVARRDAIHAVVRWIAVLPSGAPREPVYGNRTRPATNPGKLVVLTAFGTYVTAVVELAHTGETDHRQKTLRAALPHEAITLNEFSDAEAFLAGLSRAYSGKKYKYDPMEVAPGYSPPPAASRAPAVPAVAEFRIDHDPHP